MNDLRMPRLYAPASLSGGGSTALTAHQAHYLKNVLRLQTGAKIRLFNEHEGEFRGVIQAFTKGGADVELLERIRAVGAARPAKHLIFSPIKKQRMDFLVEKSVELGVTHLHPALMQRTELRKINEDRMRAQIIEAAEQCERLDIPLLSPLRPLPAIIVAWEEGEIFWAAERIDAPHIRSIESKNAFLIGPEGGFAPNEIAMLERQKKIRAVSLGPDILRSETAALYCLI